MKKTPLICLLIFILAISAFLLINHKWIIGKNIVHPQSNKTPENQSSSQIVFYHYWDKDFEKLKEELINQEQKYNTTGTTPTLQIKPLTHEAYKKNMNAMMEDGSYPELFSYWAGARTQALVNANELSPIDDIWLQGNLNSVFSDFAKTSASTYNNQKYLIPLTQCYIVFFYNKHIFKKLGLKPPKTWAELLACCEKIKTSGKTPIALGIKYRWPAQYWFDYILLRTAGHDYRHKLMTGKAKYTDPEVVKTFSYWKVLIDQGFFDKNLEEKTWKESAKMVFDGNAAMLLMGTWTIDAFTKWNWKEKEDFDFFHFPIIDKTIPTAMTTVIDGLILSKSDANQRLADQALLYFAKTDVQKAVSRASGNFSPSKEVPLSFYSPLKQQIIKSIPKTLAFPYDLDTPPEVEVKGLEMFRKFIAKPQTYKTLLQDMEKEVRPLFQKQ